MKKFCGTCRHYMEIEDNGFRSYGRCKLSKDLVFSDFWCDTDSYVRAD